MSHYESENSIKEKKWNAISKKRERFLSFFLTPSSFACSICTASSLDRSGMNQMALVCISRSRWPIVAGPVFAGFGLVPEFSRQFSIGTCRFCRCSFGAGRWRKEWPPFSWSLEGPPFSWSWYKKGAPFSLRSKGAGDPPMGSRQTPLSALSIWFWVSSNPACSKKRSKNTNFFGHIQ